jgi:hypothetical protein
MEILIEAIGTKPLLLHNVDLANPFNEYARKMGELRGIPSKRRTDAWHADMAYANFMGAFYDIPEIDGIAIPAENLRRAIINAATLNRLGTAVTRALSVTVAAGALIFDGPKTPQALWDSGRFQLTRMIRGTGGASPTTYPMFRDWAIRVPFDLDETVLNERELRDIAERAGRIEGLGASRKQGYGRFDALLKAT